MGYWMNTTFDFDCEEHLVEVDLAYKIVDDDYGVPGSPTFLSVADYLWSHFTVDNKEMTDGQIIELYGQSFLDKITDHCGWLVENKDLPLY